MTTLILLSFALFVAYVAVIIACNGGMPASISDSFYILNAKTSGLGYVFTLWCFAIGISVMAVIFGLSDGEWYQFIGLFAGGALGFVGTAPLFKSHQETIHFTAAAVCATASAVYVSLLGYYILLIPVAVTVLVARKNRMFYSELAIFIITYASLLMSLNRI
jgi:hypothetical protein